MDGTLLDVSYEPPHKQGATGRAIVWVKDTRGIVHRLPEPFTPVLYASASTERLRRLEAELPQGAGAAFRTRAKCGLAAEDTDVLAIPVPDARRIQRIAQAIDAWGGYRDVELYDADLRMSHRWFTAKGLFPFAKVRVWAPGRYRLLDDQWATDYPEPDLKRMSIDAKPESARGEIPGHHARMAELRIDDHVHQGREEDLIDILQAEIRDNDPDVILTRGGDTFLLPYLYERAKVHGIDLVLGREKEDPSQPSRGGKSYFTYGKIKWMAPSWALAGRIHLDTITSFFYAEAGLHGLVDLSRVARVPLQEMARLGAGTAVTAIQVDLAKSEGRLIPWKKNSPERFRTARSLLAGDRGGYIFEPSVGVHEDVIELDFASLYPNIMVTRNISAEVILCDCCAPPAHHALPHSPHAGLPATAAQPDIEVKEDEEDKEEREYSSSSSPSSLSYLSSMSGWADGHGQDATRAVEDMLSWTERMHHRKVPQLDSWTCAKRTGFIPRAIGPVIARREAFKKMRKTRPDQRQQYQECVDVYKWLLVTSFGYQGYKNAKFGRIECHEAIGAWGRDILLRACEIARDHGFERIHGIVDALWLARSPGANEGVPSAVLGQEISEVVREDIGIPFEYEGRYKWIVFLPNRRDKGGPDAPAVGALNRYYGCFDRRPDKPNRSQPGQPLDHLADGTLKVRGVEYRQHSTPPLLQNAQKRYLETLAPAEGREDVLRLLPDALDAVLPVLSRVRRGEARLDELVHVNAVGRALEEYRANTFAHAAVKQLARADVRVEAGQSVRFVVLDQRAKDHTRRVVETRLMKGDESYDRAYYERLVIRSIASLALPFGWDEPRLAARWSGGTQRTLFA